MLQAQQCVGMGSRHEDGATATAKQGRLCPPTWISMNTAPCAVMTHGTRHNVGDLTAVCAGMLRRSHTPPCRCHARHTISGPSKNGRLMDQLFDAPPSAPPVRPAVNSGRVVAMRPPRPSLPLPTRAAINASHPMIKTKDVAAPDIRHDAKHRAHMNHIHVSTPRRNAAVQTGSTVVQDPLSLPAGGRAAPPATCP